MVDLTRRSLLLRAGAVAASTLSDLAPPVGASGVHDSSDISALIERERLGILDTMTIEDVPGAAICFLHEGKPVWTEGLGVTDRKTDRRVGSGTIFSIQSTSKNFTATAIMIAVQRGLLSLDEPITTYVPTFTVQSRFESAPQERMTLRLLLSHRAGFTHEAPIGNNYEPAFPDFEAHVRSIGQTWLRHPVGERYRYSNLGIDLAGYILQTMSGLPFAECLKTMVFAPLGMVDSTAATEVYTARKDRAIGHEKGYAAVPLKTPLIPSGGVYTSARDMASYLCFHLNRGNFAGKTILDESMWHEMHGFSLGGDYGLGIIRTELRHGETPVRILNHRGGGFGFGCTFSYCPQTSLAWAALFNRPAAGAYRFGEGLLDAMLTRCLGPRKPRLPASDLAPIQLQMTELQGFVGTWIGRDFVNEITFDNGLLRMRVGSATTELQFTSPDEAFIAESGQEAVTYRYIPAGQGEGAHLECAIGERSMDYNDGPNDAQGPGLSGWERYEGQYRIDQWGRPSQQVVVHLRRGYLYLDKIRLVVEIEPGLFFTSDGEAVDFRHEPTWRNIRLRRLSL